MDRLGRFTGTIYPSGTDVKTIKECCLLIPTSINSEYFKNCISKVYPTLECYGCMACEKASKHTGIL